MVVTLLERSRSFNTDWQGSQAKAVQACGVEISKRFGRQNFVLAKVYFELKVNLLGFECFGASDAMHFYAHS